MKSSEIALEPHTTEAGLSKEMEEKIDKFIEESGETGKKFIAWLVIGTNKAFRAFVELITDNPEVLNSVEKVAPATLEDFQEWRKKIFEDSNKPGFQGLSANGIQFMLKFDEIHLGLGAEAIKRLAKAHVEGLENLGKSGFYHKV